MISNRYRSIFKIALISLLLIYITSCANRDKKVVYRDWNEIKTEGLLRAITMQNSTSYFIYRGEEMGCEYELIKQFADNHNLKLEIIVAQSYEEIITLLKEGK